MNSIRLTVCTWSLESSSLLAGRSWRRALLSCTLISVLFSQSCRGSTLASKSCIWDCKTWEHIFTSHMYLRLYVVFTY